MTLSNILSKTRKKGLLWRFVIFISYLYLSAYSFCEEESFGRVVVLPHEWPVGKNYDLPGLWLLAWQCVSTSNSSTTKGLQTKAYFPTVKTDCRITGPGHSTTNRKFFPDTGTSTRTCTNLNLKVLLFVHATLQKKTHNTSYWIAKNTDTCVTVRRNLYIRTDARRHGVLPRELHGVHGVYQKLAKYKRMPLGQNLHFTHINK